MKTVFIILTSTIVLPAIHFSNIVVADDKPKIEKEQVGRFTLHIANKEDKHVVYRIDTVTGDVSIFDPNQRSIISDEDISKVSSKPELARDLKAKGYLVIENTYWKKIPEKLESLVIEMGGKK